MIFGPENRTRALRLIDEARETFRLDLADMTVLTEAASAETVLGTLTAARAGSKRVCILPPEERFHRTDHGIDALMSLAERCGVADRIVPLTSRSDDAIGPVDIATYSGLARPFDGKFLSRVKPTAVVPLLPPPWDGLPPDLDTASCHRLGLSILGIDSRAGQLQTLRYIGHAAIKRLYAAGLDVFRSRIVVFGSGEFARSIVSTLTFAGADVDRMFCHRDERTLSYPDESVLKHAEAVVIAEPHHDRLLLGRGGAVDPRWLAEQNPALIVVHLCGNADRSALSAVGIDCAPQNFASAESLRLAGDFLGPRPLVDLHAAGLRVGQLLVEARRSGLSAREAEDVVLNRCQFARVVTDEHSANAMRGTRREWRRAA